MLVTSLLYFKIEKNMAFLIELPQSPRYDRVVMPRKRVTDAFSPEKMLTYQVVGNFAFKELSLCVKFSFNVFIEEKR
jgi:hypothetical protein